MKRFVLAAAALLVAAPAFADLAVKPINKVAGHLTYTYNAATGAFDRAADGSVTRIGPNRIWDASFESGYFFPVNNGGSASQQAGTLNWGDIATGSEMGGFSFNYFLDGTAGTVDVQIGWFESDNGFNDLSRTPLDPNFGGGILVTGLPPSPGGVCCSGWIITLDLEGSGYQSTFSGPDLDADGLTDFSYTYNYPTQAGSFYIGPGLQGNPLAGDNCPGNEDAFDFFDPFDMSDPNNYDNTYWFGGYPPNPYASFYLVIYDTLGGGCPNTGCETDINGDCIVDLTDLSTLLANFGGPGGPGEGDNSGDGVVDLTDLSNLLAQFGNNCN